MNLRQGQIRRIKRRINMGYGRCPYCRNNGGRWLRSTAEVQCLSCGKVHPVTTWDPAVTKIIEEDS